MYRCANEQATLWFCGDAVRLTGINTFVGALDFGEHGDFVERSSWSESMLGFLGWRILEHEPSTRVECVGGHPSF